MNTDLLAGDGDRDTTFKEARRMAEETCNRNRACDRQKMREAWDRMEKERKRSPRGNSPKPLTRLDQARVTCHAHGGSNCDDTSDDGVVKLVQWMCGRGYTTGYTGRCNEIKTKEQADEEFGGDRTLQHGEAWAFNARTLCPGTGRLVNGRCFPGGGSPTGGGGTNTGGRTPQTSSPPPGMYAEPIVVTVDEGGTASFKVHLSKAVTTATTVRVESTDGTAQAGSDYTPVTKTVTILKGRTSSAPVEVAALNDDEHGDNEETFLVALSDPTAPTVLSTSHSTVTVTITDRTPLLPKVSLTEARYEAEEGFPIEFVVQLNTRLTTDTQVSFSLDPAASNAASLAADLDFSSDPGCRQAQQRSVVIPAGQTEATVSVCTVDDDLYETSEEFTLTLTEATGSARLVDPEKAVGVIVNNDWEWSVQNLTAECRADGGFMPRLFATWEPPGGFRPQSHEMHLGEALQHDELQRGGNSASDWLRSYTQLGTQTYLTTDARRALNGGSLAYNEKWAFAIRPYTSPTYLKWDDHLAADPENAKGYSKDSYGFARHNGGLVVDVPGHKGKWFVAWGVCSEPVVSVMSDAEATEGDPVVFTVRLNGAAATEVSVGYLVTAGTAQAGSDYPAHSDSGRATIPAGERTASISVPTVDDSDEEDNETFTLTLALPENATLGTSSATGTITDDDEPADTTPPLLR